MCSLDRPQTAHGVHVVQQMLLIIGDASPEWQIAALRLVRSRAPKLVGAVDLQSSCCPVKCRNPLVQTFHVLIWCVQPQGFTRFSQCCPLQCDGFPSCALMQPQQAPHRYASRTSPNGSASHPWFLPARHSHDPGQQRLHPGPVGTSSTVRYNADTVCDGCLSV